MNRDFIVSNDEYHGVLQCCKYTENVHFMIFDMQSFVFCLLTASVIFFCSVTCTFYIRTFSIQLLVHCPVYLVKGHTHVPSIIFELIARTRLHSVQQENLHIFMACVVVSGLFGYIIMHVFQNIKLSCVSLETPKH